MKPGMKVTVGGRSGVIKALRPGDSVDVQFDGEAFVTRHGAAHVKPLRENGRRSRNPGPRGGLTSSEREALPEEVFALPGRRFPINDRRHAVIAMQYLLRGFVRAGEEKKVIAAIKKRYPPTDPRNSEIWSFYSRHSERLPAMSNPAGDVYDPSKEQFRAVVQGVYESQVRRELGLPSSTPFVDGRDRRLDASLDQDTKKRLLSSAYAIATRQGQRHGWLEPGTQTPTARGVIRSAERLSERESAEANRQDYERTLGAVRGSAYYRVVTQVVEGQKRYVVQPRPPSDLVKIPEYRLNEASAVADAEKAEAARSKAPFDVRARSNPYYARRGANAVETFDIPDAPESTIIQDGDTLEQVARRLRVDPTLLGRYGIVERPAVEDDGSPGWDEMPPGRLIQRRKVDTEREYRDERGELKTQTTYKLVPALSGDRRFWDTPRFLKIDKTLVGYRVSKPLLLQQFGLGEGSGLTAYNTPQERDEEAVRLEREIQQERVERDRKRALAAAAEREKQEAEERRIAELQTAPQAALEAELAGLTSSSRYKRYLRARKVAEEAASGITSKGAKLRIQGTAEAEREAREAVGEQVISRVNELERELRRRAAEAAPQTTRATAPTPPPVSISRPLPPVMQQVLDLAAPRKVIVSYLKTEGVRAPLYPVSVYYVPVRYGPAETELVNDLRRFLSAASFGTSGQSDFGEQAVLQKTIAVFPTADAALQALKARLDLLKSKNDPNLASSVSEYEKAVERLPFLVEQDRMAYITGLTPASLLSSRSGRAAVQGAGELITGQQLMEGASPASQMAALGAAVGSIQYEMSLKRCLAYEMSLLGDNPTVDQRIDALERCYRDLMPLFGAGRSSTMATTTVANDLRRLLLSDPEELKRRYLSTVLRQPDTRPEIMEAIKDLNKPKRTPSELAALRAKKGERISGPFWDIEYIVVEAGKGPDDKPRYLLQERYVLYLPRTLRTITKVQRDQGLVRFSDAGARRYVRFRGSAPARGPLAPPSPPSDIYMKQDDEVSAAEKELAEARSKGDIRLQSKLLNKIANIRRSQKRYKDALSGLADPYLVESYENVEAAKKLNLFNFRKKPSAASVAPRMSLLGVLKSAPTVAEEEAGQPKFLDPSDSWVEDLSFRAEKGKLRGFDTATGKTASLDPRTGMVKFYTTNPLLAYYTILLWNTPELFTGTTIILPTTSAMTGGYQRGDEEGETFTTVSVAPITEDNPNENVMKVYEDLQAAIIRAKGVFAAATLAGEFEEAAAAWVKLMGVPAQPGQPRLAGLIESVQKIKSASEPLPSAKEVLGEWGYEKAFRDDFARRQQEAQKAEKQFREGILSAEKYAEARAIHTEEARALREVMMERGTGKNALTQLMEADIAQALIFGSGVQDRVLAAWEDVQNAVRVAVKERQKALRLEMQQAQASGAPKQIIERLAAEFEALQMLSSGRRETVQNRRRFGFSR